MPGSHKGRYLIRISLFFVILISFLFILNLKVSYHQGVNYEYKFIKIPLYLKIIDFFSRHYHYKDTLERIIAGCKSQEEKVLKIFNWTHENIKPVPNGFPVIDDHVWHIIIRGYGVDDQFHDVFTTFCNYAGVRAFFTWVKSYDQKSKAPFSFVNIDGKWRVLDPYRGIYFKDSKGNLADIDTIKSGAYRLSVKIRSAGPEYRDYINNFPYFDDIGLVRANTQSPLNRLLLEISKLKDTIFNKRSNDDR